MVDVKQWNHEHNYVNHEGQHTLKIGANERLQEITKKKVQERRYKIFVRYFKYSKRWQKNQRRRINYSRKKVSKKSR